MKAKPKITIGEILVKGNKALNEIFIVTLSRHTIGEPATYEILLDMQTNLIRSGNFGYNAEDIMQAVIVTSQEIPGKPDQRRVVIQVEENPTINRLRIEGNGPVEEKEVRGRLHIKEGHTVYNPISLGRDAQDIQDHYNRKGYIVTLGQNTGFDEKKPGEFCFSLVVTRVKGIKFEKDEPYPDEDFSRWMKTKTGDYYNRFTFERDLKRLMSLNRVNDVKPSEQIPGDGTVTLTVKLTLYQEWMYPERKFLPAEKKEFPVTQWDKKNAIVLPLVYSPPPGDNAPKIRLRVNGKTLLFVVDTGVDNPLLIDVDTASRLKLTPISPLSKSMKPGYMYPAALKSVFLPTQNGSKYPVDLRYAMVTKFNDSLATELKRQNLNGIIGISFLTHLAAAAQFDFYAKTLTLFPEPMPPFQKPGTYSLDMEPANDPRYKIMIRGGHKREFVPMMVDTGCATFVLTEESSKRFTFTKGEGYSGQQVGIDGVQDVKVRLLTEIKTDEWTDKRLPVSITKDRTNNLFGMELMCRYRVTLDFVNQKLNLEPAPDFEERSRLRGLPGFDAVPYNKKMLVLRVVPGSPAMQAGLKVGDWILKVNGKSARITDPLTAMNQLNETLTAPEGSPVTLTIQIAKNRIKTIRYQTGSIFSLPQTQRPYSFGITISPGLDGYLSVKEVEEDSAFEKAGIKVDDTILTVNGRSVQGELMTRFFQIMDRATRTGEPITLTVRRKGESKSRRFTVRPEKVED